MTKKEKQEKEDKFFCDFINEKFKQHKYVLKGYELKHTEVKFFQYQIFGNFGLQVYVDGEPFATLTVNIEPLQYREFCVDVNNFPGALEFLYENGIAKPTPEVRRSGYCIYPVWKLNKMFIDGAAEAAQKAVKEEERKAERIKIINDNPLIYNYCNDEHTGEEFITELAGYILDFGQGDCYGVRCTEYCSRECFDAVTQVIKDDFKEAKE
jgi:hypothetical protein